MRRPQIQTVLAVVLAVALVASTFALGASALSHEAEDAEPQETSHLRLAHASPDAPAVDVAIENETVVEGAEFGDVTEYNALQRGVYNVTVSPAGDANTTVLEGNLTIGPRTVRTVSVTGELDENGTALGFDAVFDDAYEPEENMSAISVYHLSPDAPAVDVTAANGSVVLADNLTFENASNYVTVPAGNYTAEVRAATATNDGDVVATANVSLEEESAYTARALGYLAPAEAPADTAFHVNVTEDATKTINFPGEEPPVEAPPEEAPPEDAPPGEDVPGEGPPDDTGPPAEPGEDLDEEAPDETEDETPTEVGTETDVEEETDTPAEVGNETTENETTEA